MNHWHAHADLLAALANDIERRKRIMERWYFTFGLGQPLADYYVIIYAFTASGAREVMLEQFGKCWSFQYREDLWTDAFPQHFSQLKPIGPLEATHHHERKAQERAVS